MLHHGFVLGFWLRSEGSLLSQDLQLNGRTMTDQVIVPLSFVGRLWIRHQPGTFLPLSCMQLLSHTFVSVVAFVAVSWVHCGLV